MCPTPRLLRRSAGEHGLGRTGAFAPLVWVPRAAHGVQRAFPHGGVAQTVMLCTGGSSTAPGRCIFQHFSLIPHYKTQVLAEIREPGPGKAAHRSRRGSEQHLVQQAAVHRELVRPHVPVRSLSSSEPPVVPHTPGFMPSPQPGSASPQAQGSCSFAHPGSRQQRFLPDTCFPAAASPGARVRAGRALGRGFLRTPGSGWSGARGTHRHEGVALGSL